MPCKFAAFKCMLLMLQACRQAASLAWLTSHFKLTIQTCPQLPRANTTQQSAQHMCSLCMQGTRQPGAARLALAAAAVEETHAACQQCFYLANEPLCLLSSRVGDCKSQTGAQLTSVVGGSPKLQTAQQPLSQTDATPGDLPPSAPFAGYLINLAAPAVHDAAPA